MKYTYTILLLNPLPAPTKENVKRGLKEVLSLDKVFEDLRNELFTRESESTSKKEVKHHTADTFSVVGQRERENRKLQCKLCQGSNHKWFKWR